MTATVATPVTTATSARASAPTEDVELASRLRLGVTRLARKLRQEAEPGLTPSQLSALSAVERGGRLTVGELCGLEQVQPPTVSRLVATLVQAGLVTRQPDPDDRRMAWLSVTPEGTKLLQRTRRRKEAFLVKALRGLDRGEVELLRRAAPVLERLVGGAS
jgi:DNA-binding MarR family transcriptional regulator